MQSESVISQANGFSILISRDGGLSWQPAGGNWHLDTHGIVTHPRDPNRRVLATDGGVAVSSDGGATFQRVDRGFPTVQVYTCAIGLRDSSSLFGGSQDNAINIYRGAADGAWEISQPPRRGDITGISVHPGRPEEVVTVTAEALGLGISVNEGRTWQSGRDEVPAGLGALLWFTRLARSPLHPEQLYFGQGTHLETSLNSGRSWEATRVRQSGTTPPSPSSRSPSPPPSTASSGRSGPTAKSSSPRTAAAAGRSARPPAARGPACGSAPGRFPAPPTRC